MTYTTKESAYDLLTDLETVYPDAAKAFRLAVAEMPEGLTRCKDCDNWCGEWSDQEDGHIRYTKPTDFCSRAEPKED